VIAVLCRAIRQWWLKRLIRNAQHHLDAERWDQAAELAAEAAKIAPDSIHAWMVLGMANFRQQDCDSAVECFMNILKVQPDNMEARSHLAMTYARAKRWDKAAEIVEGLAEKDPDRVEPASALKIMKARMQEAPPAAEPAPPARAPQAAPPNAKSVNDLVRQGDWPGLKAAAESALATNPANAGALLQLGMALYRTGKGDDALKAYDRALAVLKRESDKAVVNFNRSTVLMQLNRWEDACKGFEGLGTLPAEHRGKLRMEAVLYNLAFCYRQRKMIKMARATYEKLDLVNPSYKDVAQCLQRLRVPLAAKLSDADDDAGTIACENCRKKLPLGATFCPACGWAADADQQVIMNAEA